MSEKDLNLEWNVDIEDLSSLDLDGESLEGFDVDDVLDEPISSENDASTDDLISESPTQRSNIIDETTFLESWNNIQIKKNVLKDHGCWMTISSVRSWLLTAPSALTAFTCSL